MGKLPQLKLFSSKSWSTWIILGLLSFLTACNSELADLSPIKYAPFKLTTNNISTYSRIFIYMTKSDGSEAFSKIYNTIPEINMEVPRGTYHFYGITYNGTTVSQCAISQNIKVTELENPVVLNFDSSTCSEEIFVGPSATLNSGTPATPIFAETELEFCENLSGITSAFDECSDDMTNGNRKSARGHVYSYRYTLMEFSKTRGVTTPSGSSLWSGCLNTGLTGLSGLSSSMVANVLPAGDGYRTPFLIRLELWPGGTGCGSGEPIILDLQNGLVSNNPRAKYFVKGSTHKLFLRANGNDICKGSNLSGEFAGGLGIEASPKLICSEEQFYHIFPVLVAPTSAAAYTSYANFHYKLLTDIDLSDNPVKGAGFNPPWASCIDNDSNFMPIGTTYNGTTCSHVPTSGVFDGGGKTIKGLRIFSPGSYAGFFKNISNARIQRLTLDDARIRSLGYGGTLAGYSSNSNIREITIKYSRVNTELNSAAGGMVGQDNGSQLRDIVISDIRVFGGYGVGGLAGIIDVGTSGPILNRIFIDGEVVGEISVGGIAGVIGNSGKESFVNQVRFKGSVTVENQFVGGLFAEARATSIFNSYARANYISNLVGPTVNLGGLVAFMSNKIPASDNGIHRSYVTGSLTHSCTPLTTTCNMGTVVGNYDASFNALDFYTTAYPVGRSLSSSPVVAGAPQPDASFMSLTPGWTGSGGDIMSFFLPTIWSFNNDKLPELVVEPK